MTSFRRREAFMGYLFLTPWLLGFLIFLAGPMVASLYFSFTEYKVIKAPLWIGLANYQRMLGDDLFWHSLSVTGRYTLASVPLGIAVALALATLLNQRIILLGLFRTFFYLPSLVSGVAVAIAAAWSSVSTSLEISSCRLAPTPRVSPANDASDASCSDGRA